MDTSRLDPTSIGCCRLSRLSFPETRTPGLFNSSEYTQSPNRRPSGSIQGVRSTHVGLKQATSGRLAEKVNVRFLPTAVTKSFFIIGVALPKIHAGDPLSGQLLNRSKEQQSSDTVIFDLGFVTKRSG